MKTLRFRGAVLALAAVVVFAVAAGAAVLFLDFYGYDYWNPLTMPITTQQSLKISWVSADTNVIVGARSDSLVLGWSLNWGL